MTCREVQSKLSAYHDGELAAVDAGRVAAHLADCPDCTAYLGDLAAIGNVLRSAPVGEPSVRLRARLVDATPRVRQMRWTRWRWWLPRVAAAAAGFVVYVSLYGLAVAPAAEAIALAADDYQIEQALHESALALAGQGLAARPSPLFGDSPEATLLDRLLAEAQP